MGVRRAHDRLYVGGRGRVDDAGWRPIAARHGVLAVTADRFFGAIDAVGAERTRRLRRKTLRDWRRHGAPLMLCAPCLVTRCRWRLGSATTGALVASSSAACGRGTGSRKRLRPVPAVSVRRSPSPATRRCAQSALGVSGRSAPCSRDCRPRRCPDRRLRYARLCARPAPLRSRAAADCRCRPSRSRNAARARRARRSPRAPEACAARSITRWPC